ncbi:MAG: type II toxin-antitoxin system VapC family toxin [Terriglobales bacterium]
MKFWDTSAIVPLLADEGTSERVRAAAAADPEMVVWWGTEVECASALARLERQAGAAGRGLAALYARLTAMSRGWIEVEPGPEVKSYAVRLLRVHALRSGDALQLAAALVACGHQPATLAFVTLDERLAQAAEREGFALA